MSWKRLCKIQRGELLRAQPERNEQTERILYSLEKSQRHIDEYLSIKRLNLTLELACGRIFDWEYEACMDRSMDEM